MFKFLKKQQNFDLNFKFSFQGLDLATKSDLALTSDGDSTLSDSFLDRAMDSHLNINTPTSLTKVRSALRFTAFSNE